MVWFPRTTLHHPRRNHTMRHSNRCHLAAVGGGVDVVVGDDSWFRVSSANAIVIGFYLDLGRNEMMGGVGGEFW